MHTDYDKDTIVKNQRQYRYDPDYDCFYPVYSRDDYDLLSHWDKYSWLYVLSILIVICVMVS